MLKYEKNTTIIDYILWRGDITFDKDPFNYVDSLIFSELSYVNFDQVLDEEMTISSAYEKYLKHNKLKDVLSEFSFINNTVILLALMAQTKRYQNLLLTNYKSIFNYEKEEQFCAINIILPNDIIYVSFRGTDDTILGWKEDFNMTYMMEIPSQRDAVTYLNNSYTLYTSKNGIFSLFKKPKLILGGHSKGGNLAVYSAVKADKKIKAYIEAIHNFDGPGFHQEFLDSDDYQEIKHKILNFKPKGSLFGNLLKQDSKTIIVNTIVSSLMQHSGLNWQVRGKKLCVIDELEENATKLSEKIDELLDTLDFNEREVLWNSLFKVLNDSNITMIDDLTSVKVSNIISGLKTLSEIDSKNRKILIDFLTMMVKHSSNVVIGNPVRRK